MSSAAWAPFLAVVLCLTAVVLGLARQSSSTLTQAETTDSPPADRQSTEPTPQLTSHLLLANVAVTQGVVAAVVAVAAWYFSIPAGALGVSVTPGRSSASLVLAGVGFGVLLWIVNELSTTVADAVGAAYDERLRGMLAPDSPGGWLTLYAVVLPLIAVSEELLFRAALIGVPAAGYGLSPLLLAVLSSVAFALGHGAQGRAGVLVTGGLGLVLAGGYVVSGSLLFVIVSHYVVNALEFLIHEQVGVGSVFEWLLPVGEQNAR